MKSIIITAALFVASFFAFSPASAQGDSRVQAQIPFAFTVGDATIPAGNYVIASQASSPFVRLENSQGNISVSAQAFVDSSATAGTGRLVFHRYGDQYFLTRISKQGSFANLHFTQTKAEKRAKSRDEMAGIPPSDPILVALN